MKEFTAYRFLPLLFFLLSSCAVKDTSTTTRDAVILPPEELYGDLFFDVQQDENIFPDSKTFVDVIPFTDVEEIREKYTRLEVKSTPFLLNFLEEHFIIPDTRNNFESDSVSIQQNISGLWEVLKRPADEVESGTLIPLPNPYIVPGGRFREIYYWDSYFTMLGLQVDGEEETIRNMVDNFSYLIDTYGFIPNGNRTYYLGRSQPPYYAKMVEVLAEIDGEDIYGEYLPYLEKEYEFWMKDSESITESGSASKRVVKMPDGELLNRYWDEYDTPRPESYREDVETAEAAIKMFPDRTRADVYRNLRAGAESGWDFSSRWLSRNEDGEFKLSSIHTIDIVPVDLNALLYNLEATIAAANELEGNNVKAAEFHLRAEARKNAIEKYFWSDAEGFYMDYNFRKQEHTPVLSLAGVYPLFFQIAYEERAKKVAVMIERTFLSPGGVITTPYNTGQQWDAPNGWAPLQWVTIQGLRKYGETALATDIKNRWLQLNTAVYKRSFKMLEKYNVQDLSRESGGGEYPTQDGFGWTNGVYQKLVNERDGNTFMNE
ncbi:MAG TPA: alpha,alpha-trehalase TreF [Gillisia sp.]|nr:alpha,alpha-trehalase TreF [Gillisia sp.]